MSETPDPTPPTPTDGGEARERLAAVRSEVAKAVVGQDAAVSGLLVALLCGGHVLMEGVPGVAKTLLVRTLAGALSVDTRRVQFTPDLMPGDITGSMVIDGRQGELTFREGPVFTNLLLADEINRTPPKTQSALLEAMEEGQVSVDGVSRPLPRPFLVAATQNPVEYEGTYPLPEAQLDRFLLKVVLPVPDRNAELEILRRHAAGFDPRDVAAAGVRPVAGADDIVAARAAVGRVQVSPAVAGYIVDIARATRESPSLSLGVSPRGATALLRSARAWAWLTGRDFVTPDDVKALAHATLRAPARPAPGGRARGGRGLPGARVRARLGAGPPVVTVSISGRVPLLLLLGAAAVVLRPEMSTMWLWVLAVALLVGLDLLLAPPPAALALERAPASGRSGSASRLRPRCSRPTARADGCTASCATPGSPPPAPPATGIGSRSPPGDRVAADHAAAPAPTRRPARGRRDVRLRGPLGLASRQRTREVAGSGPRPAAVRVAQAPAEPAGPAARPRRARRGARARAGHRVRLAARVRPGRRRPLDRLAGQRTQPQRRRTHLAAGARPPGRPGARHVAYVGGPGRRRAPAGLRDGRRAAAGRARDARRATGSTSSPATGGCAAGCASPATATSRPGSQEAMADLDPVIAEADWNAIAGAVNGLGRQRALVVLLTPLEPSAVEEGLLPVLATLTRHHRVVLASVRDPELEQLAGTRETLDEVYDAAAAEQVIGRRRHTAGLLRALGVDVVDADDLPPALADHYLALKARGLL